MTIPSVAILTPDGDKVGELRVYIDVAPLYEASALKQAVNSPYASGWPAVSGIHWPGTIGQSISFSGASTGWISAASGMTGKTKCDACAAL